MNNIKPLVSVFIPYYNDKEFLKDSIESILNQTYQNFELILLNHASTDGSREIAHSYNDDRIKHIDMPYNLSYGGSGLLLQEFLKIAKGKYVKLFCADDMMMQDCLEKLVDYMEEHFNIDFAFGDIEYVNKKGKDLKDSWFKSRSFFNLKDNEVDCVKKYLDLRGFLPYIGSIVRRELFFNITINTTFVMLFDMSLWLEFLCAGYKIGFLNKIICKYRIHEKQMSSPKQRINSLYFGNLELTSFWHIFQKMQSVEFVKKVFYTNKYVDLLVDKKDIPFFVAQAILEKKPYAISAYAYITDLLNDKEQREYLQKKFGYGIKQLREQCMVKLLKGNILDKIKIRVYSKQVNELNILDLIILFCRNIIIPLKFILRKDRSL